MTTVSFHPQFLIDLVTTGDAQLSNRALKKLFTDRGEFRTDRDDHPYHGIDNAWIRVVSRRNTAYRAIYIREGGNITLYRIGPHSVEDDLAAPALRQGFPIVAQSIIDRAMAPMGIEAAQRQIRSPEDSVEQSQASPFLKNHERRFLYEQMIGRRLLPHKEAILVSPYLSFQLLKSTDRLGQMFDEWIGDGCDVIIITLPPKPSELPEYGDLRRRGFTIWHVQNLHAKTYFFRLDRNKLNDYQQDKQDLALLGSANLTTAGFNPLGERASLPQLELSYKIPESDHEELEAFVNYLAGMSTNHDILRQRLS